VAPYFYGAAMAAFGVIQLVTQNFLSSLLQVPPTLPLRWIWMLLSSAVFILTGLCIVFGIRRQLALVAVGTLLAIFLLALQLPALLMNLHNANDWAVTFEGVMLTSGAFIIAAESPDETLISRRWNRTIHLLAMIGHYLFALSLFVFCIQHIMYFDYILSLIPTWMPVRMVLDYVVVVGYLLCGISWLSGSGSDWQRPGWASCFSVGIAAARAPCHREVECGDGMDEPVRCAGRLRGGFQHGPAEPSWPPGAGSGVGGKWHVVCGKRWDG
jgi:uncharacterized membrane protein